MVVDDGWRRTDFCGSVIEETREIKCREGDRIFEILCDLPFYRKENIKKGYHEKQIFGRNRPYHDCGGLMSQAK